ncbi:hypothetical protein EMIHUDRAFT_373194 [Emiliania huxleyi CCMP1516]|uniref:Uncharacterized protein n=2 Tax=Emiliania huxleyi TaxID=2903 RepID=A0A0D3KMX4_EMIH1|nr:hypothetical protein EMIHUDRAFT_373194 [Emiliania huxleyi CCMP1516]EOD37109.1 hypothetical protein EMIHUDRAFT_373194 [Emiliania huxleyi CCMP1516]|eukprot:XP_005789538.1 hypothetical protein EMIHUDRAFT_373194 [Emiliania huxleyi CCMP1516]
MISKLLAVATVTLTNALPVADVGLPACPVLAANTCTRDGCPNKALGAKGECCSNGKFCTGDNEAGCSSVPGGYLCAVAPKYTPPRVSLGVEFINNCPYDVFLDGWGSPNPSSALPTLASCYVPKASSCVIGKSCTTDEPISQGHRCDVAAATRTPDLTSQGTRVTWWPRGQQGMSQMIEMNPPRPLTFFKGEGDKLGHVSFSNYDGFSMSAMYVALDESDNVACADGGAKFAIGDPLPDASSKSG